MRGPKTGCWPKDRSTLYAATPRLQRFNGFFLIISLTQSFLNLYNTLISLKKYSVSFKGLAASAAEGRVPIPARHATTVISHRSCIILG
jgi:hypothetical protein